MTELWLRTADHVLCAQPWGADSIRVRVGRKAIVPDIPGALELTPAEVPAVATETSLTVGRLRLDVIDGLLRFSKDGEELLAEQPGHFAWPGPRLFAPNGDGYHRLEQRFRAYPGEKVFGLGQHQHGRLDQKGMVLDLVQRNAEVSIPFALSSRGYGLLWNLPAIGRVEFAENGTRWVADSARQIDYWVTTGDTPADILSHYADATGHAPALPHWATGFWQSKLRYRNQDELLAVAREHRDRGLPLSVIVADYFHWTHLGDWRFDPAEWPDPAAMVKELDGMGVKLMVSVWPSVNPLSENYEHMRDNGFLVGAEQGLPLHQTFPDKGFGEHKHGVAFYDATDPAAREFVWSRLKAGYYDHGIRVWWLDACEPEIFPEQFGNLRFAAGPGREVANLYPREHVRGLHEHMTAEGEDDSVSLVRSAWAGSQRFGAALWSGDIPATFAALGKQIRAGLNVAVSGIPWWTTDIGGFHGGDPASAEYRELMIRWFQYGVFCPLFRLHGHREPRIGFGAGHSGGPNEVWSYGAEAYEIIADQLRLRERLRGYIGEQLAETARTGIPLLRPLFVDYPDDPSAWTVEDQFLFGPDLLVAPVTELGARSRPVRLPAGTAWIDVATGMEHAGGETVEVQAPLARIPVFRRAGSTLHL
ncbi:glycoside hydrolase family 31 protein [Kutzneria sp. CA-103260]|uniref:glycoside hydrolase family 31 protein n=1 Tax=Kutzneria sp. CA-103260 TaxID=2802641 RepID=UPI001BEDAF3A|nr:TIM-barrel domain-containing protein [Kutzneria sp. CA-103260]QUQ65961.1 family 31 glucosidase [Kutzneria sp. CA-103260]